MGGGSNDSVVISGGTVGTDATQFSSRLQNVETLDFRNANTNGGAMVIDGDDVFALTDSAHVLRLDIDSSFNLNVQAGSYDIASSTIGALTSYTFSTGGTFAARLDVYVA
jgi:hypothetical protein